MKDFLADLELLATDQTQIPQVTDISDDANPAIDMVTI